MLRELPPLPERVSLLSLGCPGRYSSVPGRGVGFGGDAPSACDDCFLQIGLDTGYWTAINHFFIWGSLAVYFAILFAMHSNGLFDMFPNQFRFVGESLWLSLESVKTDSRSGTNREGRHLFTLLMCHVFWMLPRGSRCGRDPSPEIWSEI